jgi:hypothetical protein
MKSEEVIAAIEPSVSMTTDSNFNHLALGAFLMSSEIREFAFGACPERPVVRLTERAA